jgi:hypothetical protein
MGDSHVIDWNDEDARRLLVGYIVLRHSQIYDGLRGKFQLHKTLLRAKTHSEDMNLDVFDSIDFRRKQFPFFEEGMASELDTLKRQGKVIYKKSGSLRYKIADRFLSHFQRIKERMEELISLRGKSEDYAVFELINKAILEIGDMTLQQIEKEYEEEAKAIPKEMALKEYRKSLKPESEE